MKEKKDIGPTQEVRSQGGFGYPLRAKGTVAVLEGDRVLLAEINGTPEGLAIRQYAEATLPTDAAGPEALADAFVSALADALEQTRLETKSLVIALPYSFCTVDILTLPPVQGKNLDALIERKILRSGDGSGRYDAWSYRILEDKRSGDEPGIRVLLARIPSALLSRLHEALVRHDIRATSITVPLCGVLRLMGLPGSEAGEGSVMAAEITAEGAMLSLFANGTLLQTRFVKRREGTGEEQFHQILNVELRRSVAFHKEKFKGRGIDRILVLGTRAGAVESGTVFQDITLPLPEDPPESWRQRASGPKTGASCADRALLALLAGLCLAGDRKSGALFRRRSSMIDFAPLTRRAGRIKAAVALLTVLALAGVVGVTGRLSDERVRLTERRALLEKATAPLDALEARQEHLKDLEHYYQRLNAFYDSAGRERRHLARALLSLHERLPPWAILQSITFTRRLADDRKGAAPLDTILCQLIGDFTAGRGRALQDLVEDLEGAGGFSRVSYTTAGALAGSADQTGMTESIDLELVLK